MWEMMEEIGDWLGDGWKNRVEREDHRCVVYSRLERRRIDGGWLYRSVVKHDHDVFRNLVLCSHSLFFVPDADLGPLANVTDAGDRSR